MRKPVSHPTALALLPLTVRPAVDERAFSLVHRLATRRGSTDIRKFVTLELRIDNTFVGQFNQGKSIDLVAQMSGVDPEIIRAATPVVTSEGYKLGDIRLNRYPNKRSSQVAFHHQFCPTCLAEDMASREGPEEVRAYRRFWWDFGCLFGCPTHRTPLLSECPSCAKRYSYSNMRADRCMCGYDLTKAETGQPFHGIERQLLDIISGGRRAEWMTDLAVNDISNLAVLIGTMDHIPNYDERNFRELTSTQRMVFAARGSEILQLGKTAIFESLDKVVSRSPASKNNPYRDVLRRLQTLNYSSLDTLRATFADYAARSTAAGQRLQFFGQNVRPPMEDPWTGEMFVPTTGYDAFRRLSGLTAGQGAAYGAHSNPRTPGCRESSEQRYSLERVKRLLNLSSTLPVWTTATPETISIADTGRSLHRKWMLVYELVLQGKIKPVARLKDQIGLTKLLVFRKDVADALPNGRENNPFPKGSIYTCGEAAKRLMVTRELITVLRKYSYLNFEVRLRTSYREALTVTREELIAFDEIYVSGSRVASDLGLDGANLVRRLRSIGVPCIIKELGEKGGSLFLRADLQEPLKKLLAVDYRLIVSKLESVTA